MQSGKTLGSSVALGDSTQSSPQSSHCLPPPSILKLYKLAHYTPHEVFCPSCAARNEGRGFFMGVRYGSVILYLDGKGKFPDDPKLGALRGKRRAVWVIALGVTCDMGHSTRVLANGDMVHLKDEYSGNVIIKAPG